MAILRKSKRTSYTVIDNAIFRDYGLSYKAKGLLCQMLSLPDGWVWSVEGLARLSSDGKSSITSALNELENAGYFRREQNRNNGKMAGVEYIVSETKMCDFPFAENPSTGNPSAEKPMAENPPQYITDISITDTSTTKKKSNNKTSNTYSGRTRKNANLHNTPSMRPTLEEVQKYIDEKNLNASAKKFVDFFEAGEWVDSRGNPVTNWKQKLITWSDRNSDRFNGRTEPNNGSDESNTEPLGWDNIFG